MAEIPTQTASVGDSVLNGGSLPMAASPDAFGAGVGDAVDNASSEADRIHLEAMRNFNRTSVLDAHNQLDDFNQKALFDPKSGLLNTNTGAQAPAAVDKTLADYDANVSKVAGTLTNDQQKIQFARMAQENRRVVQAHLNSYETKQVQGYQESVTQATAKNAAMSAVQNVNGVITSPDPALADPTKRAAAVDRAASSSIEMGVAALKDQFRTVNPTAPANDPRLVEQVNAYQSTAHYGVVQSLLAQGQDRDAKAYFDNNKDSMQGSQRDDAALKVEAGSTAGESVRRANALAYDDQGKVRDLGDIMADIHTDKSLQDDPKLLDQTTLRVQRIAAQAEDAQREQDKSAFKDAYETMKTSPLGFNDPAVQAKIAGLTPERQEQLQSYERRQIKNEAPDAKASAQNAYMARKLRQSNPAAFKQVDYLPLLASGQLTPGAFSEITNMQLEDQNAAPMDPKASLVDPIADKYLADTKLDPNVTFKQNPEMFKKVGDFRAALKDELEARQAAKGKAPLDSDDIRSAIVDVTAPVPEKVPHWYGDGTASKPLYQHVQDMEKAMPAGTRKQAYDAFRAVRKRDPTPAEYAGLLEARAQQGNR